MQALGALELASKRKTTGPLTYGRIVHALRQLELKSGRSGTGATILKMQSKPIARLIDEKKIGPEETQSAADITLAFMSMAGALLLKPQSMERVDMGRGGPEPAHIVDAQTRYRAWADHWSMLAKRGDKTLEIVIAAVIDERPIRIIEADAGLRHGVGSLALIRGLRDYAARAGWVRGVTAALWKAEAGMTFLRRTSGLSLAMARAKAAL